MEVLELENVVRMQNLLEVEVSADSPFEYTIFIYLRMNSMDASQKDPLTKIWDLGNEILC